MIIERGIETNLEKIEAIRQMKPPTTKKGVQKLPGHLAFPNRFISRSAEKCLPFFKALKGSDNLQWGQERANTFEALKMYVQNFAIIPALRKKQNYSCTSLH